MNFTKLSETYWKADDGSNVYFNFEPPRFVQATILGRSGLVKEFPTQPIRLENLTLLRALPGGTRGTENRKWTNEYQTFAVYEYKEEFFRPQIVFTQVHGGGITFAVVDQHDFHRTFKPVVDTLPHETLYDIVEAIMGSYNEGKEQGSKAERSRLYNAFVAGNLKKRKVRNSHTYKVYVESK